MRDFSVILENQETGETMDLEFMLVDNITARKWFSRMCSDLQIHGHNSGKFSYFKDEKSKQEVVDELNDIMKLLNTVQSMFYFPFIAVDIMNGNMCNYLHDGFVRIRESAEYDSYSDEIKEANENLNKLIHLYEGLNSNRTPTLTCSFNSIERYELSDEDYDNFTIHSNRGDVFITYCVTGKAYYDVFRNKDKMAVKDIKPQNVYSSNFVIRFDDRPLAKRMEEFTVWMAERGLDVNDKRTAIGKIKVATPVNPITVDTVSKIEDYKHVKEIKVWLK